MGQMIRSFHFPCRRGLHVQRHYADLRTQIEEADLLSRLLVELASKSSALVLRDQRISL